MFQEERFKLICELVKSSPSVKVTELSTLLNASVATVRRDLEELQQQGLIMRTHGGAMLPYSVGHEKTIEQLQTRHAKEKVSIARFAATYIRPNDTIFLDESTTVQALARELVYSPVAGLTVLTTSLSVIELLSSLPSVQVILSGGSVNYEQSSVEGYASTRFIRSFRMDKCFIGVNGVDAGFGLSVPRLSEAELKTAVIESSRASYTLADGSKFGKSYFAQLPTTDFLITDTRLLDFDYDLLEQKMEVFFADERSERE